MPEPSADVPGCTDAGAGNYNADATVDDGSCCFANIMTITLLIFRRVGLSQSLYGPYPEGLVLNGGSMSLLGFIPRPAHVSIPVVTLLRSYPYFRLRRHKWQMLMAT